MKLLENIIKYEREGVQREAILSLVKDEIKAIDQKRKEIKESIEAEIKPLGAIDSTKAINVICKKGSCGEGNAARQRLSRRRNWLKGLLTAVHIDYDFSLDEGEIVATYVGDATTREAKTLFAAVQHILSLEIEIDDTLTVETIRANLENEKASGAPKQVEDKPLEVTEETVTALGRITANAQSVMDKLNEDKEKQADA